MKKSMVFLLLITVITAVSAPEVFAQAEEAAHVATGAGGGNIIFFTSVGVAAAMGMAIAAFGTGLAQSNAIKSAVESIARNPGASGKILSTLLIGLAMIESLAIYVLVIALILLFANPFLEFIG